MTTTADLIPTIDRQTTAPRTSAVLRRFIDGQSGTRVPFGELVSVLGDRAFGAILLVLALLSLLPVPGLTTVFGLPLGLVAAQLMLGAHRPWLPRAALGRTIPVAETRAVLDRTLPRLERLERALRPRLLALTQPWGERIIGALCLLLAAMLVLPIPFANFLPAVAVGLLALGLVERDGLFILLGGALAVASLAVFATVAGAATTAAVAMLTGFFG